MRRDTIAATLAAGLLAATSLPASAEIEELSIKFIGQSSLESNSSLLEQPFFEQLPEKSGGKIKVDLQPFNTLGLSGAEILRLMKTGTLEWASNGITFLAGDRPEFEGCDLAGITPTLEMAYQACVAYKPVLARIMEENWNVKLLALYGNPPQVIWCRSPIEGLDDVQGRKVRVFNKTLTDFVEGVGGTTVTIPFADVVPALQRGVADCAITGTFNGNIAKWPEVASHILGVYLGWAVQYAAVNLDTWNRLNADTQEFLEEQFLELEKDSWTRVAALTTAEGVNCNIGEEPCDHGNMVSITFVEPSPEDEEERLRIMRESVLPRWAERCGSECGEEWNATVGKVVNLTAPTQ
jgi:TRAP-type C4-dicarboxylate transport system substrate-binding protein